jgi:hypothetical protein
MAGMRTKQPKPLPKTAPGAICAQMVRCGKKNCKCARGELHGPYFYHFERVDGVLVKRYVKAKEVAEMRAACEARRRQDKQQRLMLKMNFNAVAEAVEKLRGYEKRLLQLTEESNGQAGED